MNNYTNEAKCVGGPLHLQMHKGFGNLLTVEERPKHNNNFAFFDNPVRKHAIKKHTYYRDEIHTSGNIYPIWRHESVPNAEYAAIMLMFGKKEMDDSIARTK